MKRRFLTINQWQRVCRKADDDAGTGAGGDDAAEIAKMEAEAKANKNAELATAATVAKADEEFLSPENNFSKEDFDKEEKTPEEAEAAKKVADEKIASDKAAAEEKTKADAAKKAKADEGKTPEVIAAEKKAADDAAAKKAEEGNDDDDTVLKVAEVPSDENEESDWKTVGKALGFEVQEDSFEAFQKAQGEFIASQVEEAKSSGLDNELETISKHDPKAKEVFAFVKNGGKIDDYVNPMREYDELLALGDEALVRENLKLNKWDDDKIEKHVAGLKENGTLEEASYPLRKSLENGKERTKNDLFASQQKLAESQAKVSADAKIKEDKQILDAIGKVTEYQGKKVTPEVKAALGKKWASGYYRQRFANDPEFVKEAILAYELSQQVTAAAKKAGFKEGLHKNQETLHNTPKNSQETGTRSTKASEVVKDEDFSSWKTEVNT